MIFWNKVWGTAVVSSAEALVDSKCACPNFSMPPARKIDAAKSSRPSTNSSKVKASPRSSLASKSKLVEVNKPMLSAFWR